MFSFARHHVSQMAASMQQHVRKSITITFDSMMTIFGLIWRRLEDSTPWSALNTTTNTLRVLRPFGASSRELICLKLRFMAKMELKWPKAHSFSSTLHKRSKLALDWTFHQFYSRRLRFKLIEEWLINSICPLVTQFPFKWTYISFGHKSSPI